MEEQEFNELTMFYYQKPNPARVPDAVRYFITNGPLHSYTSMAYLFGIMAKLDPSLIPEFEKVFVDTSHQGRSFMLLIFQICGNDQVIEFLKSKSNDAVFSNEKKDIDEALSRGLPLKYNPLTRAVESPLDEDCLWAEFFVTGKKEPIVRIIDVLNEEDFLKGRILAWLSDNQQNKKAVIQLKKLFGNQKIDIDLTPEALAGMSDLDCLYMSSFRMDGRRSDNGLKIKKLLGLTDKDLQYMAVKAAAMWALQSNAMQHPLVLKYCKEELAQRSDKSKIELMIIVRLAKLRE